MIILVCNLEKSRKVERVETHHQVRSDTRRYWLLIANVNSYKERDNGYKKMLFADYQPFRPNIAQAVPTQSIATCRMSCFSKQFLLFHHLLPQSWCHYSHIVQSRRGLWHAELFYGRPRCPALPECQSARVPGPPAWLPGLPGVLLCKAHQ